MLNILGPKQRFCDGITRREFLKIGGLAMGGLALPDLLRLEARAGERAPHKAIIMVFLPGGPPHQDMVDLKPEAPVEMRGEFKPIRTNVSGIQICEHMPRLAAMTDKLAIIRSIVGLRDEHASDVCYSGFTQSQSRGLAGGRPALGSYLSKLEGPVDKSIPPFVGLSPKTGHVDWGNPGKPGFLGLAYAPFAAQGGVSQDMTLKTITPDRMEGRKNLLSSFDSMRYELDARGNYEASDSFTKQALDVLTSKKLADALDVTKEDPRMRDRYGIGSNVNIDDGAPCWNDQFVVARRLVEAGARCVTLSYGRWDYHERNFEQCKERLPKLDQALSALIQDLHDRGMEKDVTVIAWGEFGRTPRINNKGGRDHWPPVSCAMLAGGGMRTGQVIGSTDRVGGSAKDRPIHVQDVFATLYHNLGIDLQRTVTHSSGRPMYLLERTEPIKELV